MSVILGISGSLRNARFGRGSDMLIDEIKGISSKEALMTFLREQTQIRSDDFIAAGRDKNLDFDEIYKNLQKQKGQRGLSNSEGSLVAALWGAHQSGCDIKHCSLSYFFNNDGTLEDKEGLKELILKSDGILLAGPVYFGDRGSLVHDFIKFLQSDEELKAHIEGLPFAGLSVGAKRNGGQETSLIYQLLDMVNSKMLGVGNDSETTSQYGGTSVGGDVGTVWEDTYGINTCIGTGRRTASIVAIKDAAKGKSLVDKLKVSIWIVQDSIDSRALKYIESFVKDMDTSSVQMNIVNLTSETVMRCLACDICPTKNGPNSEYRCIIKSKSDLFVRHHQDLIESDAILIAGYSSVDRTKTNDIYQRFMERTRYLRRGDYVFSNQLVAPLIFSEIGSRENLHLRMLTSMIRHHTVLFHPIIGTEYKDELLESDKISELLDLFIEEAKRLTVGRISKTVSRANTQYNPVGYVISSEKLKEEKNNGVVDQLMSEAETEMQQLKTRIKEQ